ncbi:MAG: toxin-antitoxin system HicB family antitoxin [Egibacteraceae bacterium]
MDNRRIEELVRLPWSRQVVADEDGVFLASIPELDGCFIDGSSMEDALERLEDILREWLELAVQEGVPIPQPARIAYEDFSGRFTVRAPRSLHRELSQLAEREGVSLNQMIVTLLSGALVNDASLPTASHASNDAHEEIVADALAHEREAIGPAKGIATFLREKGAINLACLVFSMAAERVGEAEGAAEASRELGATAALARRHGRQRLAEVLWRQSLRKDPTNLRSRSLLGQLLHHQGRYPEAAEYLEAASRVDNHALLFLGWSLLRHGLDIDDRDLATRGLRSIRSAMERWAYQNRVAADRTAWLRQLQHLVPLGPSYREEVTELVNFANANAGWTEVSLDEVWNAAATEELVSEQEATG